MARRRSRRDKVERGNDLHLVRHCPGTPATSILKLVSRYTWNITVTVQVHMEISELIVKLVNLVRKAKQVKIVEVETKGLNKRCRKENRARDCC